MGGLSEKEYIKVIDNIADDRKIRNLFEKMPKSSIFAYKKTLGYKASKEYGNSGELLPNNLFALIESSLKEEGVIRTYKKYVTEFNKLENFFGLDKSFIVETIKGLLSEKSQIRYKSVETFKDLIRKYNSQYKGHFIKTYTQDKINNLKAISEKNSKASFVLKDSDITYTFKDFMADMRKNKPSFIYEFNALLEQASNVYIEDIYDIVSAIDEGADIDTLLPILGIYEPYNYDPNYIKNNRTVNRLKNNFEPIFNKDDNSIEYRKILVDYINDLVKNDHSDKYNEIKTNDKIDIDVCYKALKKIKGYAKLDKDGSIRFISTITFNPTVAFKYLEYQKMLSDAKTFLSFAYKNYLKAKKAKMEIDSSDLEYPMNDIFDDDNYTIPNSVYVNDLCDTKMKSLINDINKKKLHNLTIKEFDSLDRLLNKDGLLFCYLIGNISTEELVSIINNYSFIYSYLKPENISINNLEEMLRIAKTFKYVRDIDIALIGYDNLVKIINYNQFAGTDVTDEVIKQRIHKAVYLAKESEKKCESSLPFDIKVKKDGLVLDRYLNNDPDVLVSGIETKTCFFISVNENDFFFYSLLNKNGFIIKITDEQGNFVARASCFRRNNILMINGIRLKNNEIIANNKEQKELMNKVVNLIEMMAEKLIYSTSGDVCPIDYVLCNKAGILENSEFDNRYEMIDFKIIREPIDIYNEDWEEFVSINKKDKTLLQESFDNPKTSFTTDFGDNYPLILIRSRNNMGLLKPSDISLRTQDAIYLRPKASTTVYTTEEIDDEILAKINRIRALYVFIGSTKRKKNKFKLIRNPKTITTAVLADDWVGITYKNGNLEYSYTNYSNLDYNELQKYASFKQIAKFDGKTKEYIMKRNIKYSNK